MGLQTTFMTATPGRIILPNPLHTLRLRSRAIAAHLEEAPAHDKHRPQLSLLSWCLPTLGDPGISSVSTQPDPSCKCAILPAKLLGSITSTTVLTVALISVRFITETEPAQLPVAFNVALSP